MLRKGRESFGPPVGRACVDCGYVMLFLKPDELAKLRQEVSGLHPAESP